MRFDLDTAFDIHARALTWRSRRAEVLAANLANADTPGYKARDLDFGEALARARGALPALARTDERHLGGTDPLDAAVKYRVPLQPSLDGNTVDTHIEHAEFVKNAVGYQTSLQLLNAKIGGIRKALRGE